MRPLLRSFAATAYLFFWRIFHLLHSGSLALFEGFWMGLLPESVTDIISQKSYQEGSRYTSAAYLDAGLYFWEEIAIQRFFPSGCRVLVASAGGGRELIALRRAGFVAGGFECCRPMVVAGQRALAERKIDCRLEWAPPCQVPEDSGIWDAAIVGWNGYTYMSPYARRVEFLRNLRRHLGSGAPVLVSFAVRTQSNGQVYWTPRIANAVRVATFRRPVFTMGTCFPGLPRHQFSPREIEAELSEAGFTPAAFWRWGPFGAAVGINGEKPEA